MKFCSRRPYFAWVSWAIAENMEKTIQLNGYQHRQGIVPAGLMYAVRQATRLKYQFTGKTRTTVVSASTEEDALTTRSQTAHSERSTSSVATP